MPPPGSCREQTSSEEGWGGERSEGQAEEVVRGNGNLVSSGGERGKNRSQAQ